jgi:hypothetical protein
LIRATGPGLQSQERVITLDRERVVSFDLGARTVRVNVRSPRRPGSSGSPIAAAPIQAPVESPLPKVSARAKSVDFDADLKTENKPREIYDEDPYR